MLSRFHYSTRYYLFALALLLTACNNERTETVEIDSTRVRHDTTIVGHEDDSASYVRSIDSAATSVTDTLAASQEIGDRLLPVDQANQDASFVKFREQMIRAIESKNAEDLMAMLDPNIRLSFGGGGGLADFKKMWKPEDKGSPLWQKLGWVLKHGGNFRGEGNDKMFWAPYVYSNWPDSGPEPFEYGAIVGSKVPVFESANATSTTVALLDHHFVKGLDGGHLREKSPAFVRIQTPSGKTGFVRSTEVRSQLDYRAGFDKRAGKWRMSIFIAGD